MTRYDLRFKRIDLAAVLTLYLSDKEARTKAGNHLGGQQIQCMQKKTVVGIRVKSGQSLGIFSM